MSHDNDAMGHVFISYVREDAERVDRLQRLLEAEGITVWRDTSDLWPGQDWRIEIRKAIESGLAFIACFSEHSESKDISYQNEELIFAIEMMRRRPPGVVWLLPVRFADCRLPPFDLGASRTLNSLQRVDLFDGTAWEPAAARLAAAVRRVQGRSEAQTAPSESEKEQGPSEGSSFRPGPGERKFSRLLDAVFGGGLPRPERGADLETEITLSSAEASRSFVADLRFEGDAPCLACSATGTVTRRCPACDGTGDPSKRLLGTVGTPRPCQECQARGVVNEPCPECTGSGHTMQNRTYRIRIPAQVKDGQRVRLKGRGAPGQHGGPAGDLYVVVHVKP